MYWVSKANLNNLPLNRTKNLATRQYALLAAAWQSVKPGGWIVYSTCSISPKENDAVVEKLIKKKGAQVSSIDTKIYEGESTDYGLACATGQDIPWTRTYLENS